MVDLAWLCQKAKDFVQSSPLNVVDAEIALAPDMVGLRLCDAPLVGACPADDPYYETLKQEGVIGAHHLSPRQWLPGACTAVSVFLPYSEEVRRANRQSIDWPATEWLHARIDGQKLAAALALHLRDALAEAGHASLSPLHDERFAAGHVDAAGEKYPYTSNWSERHNAFACGLGSFGLSRGIITERGMAGRLASVVTEAEIPAAARGYSEVYENCTMCGACAKRCPVGAISPEEGKKHPPCSDFLDAVEEKHRPYYGCGKCQVAVPCEAQNPRGGKVHFA